MPPIRVLVADDAAYVRLALQEIVADQHDMIWVGEVTGPDELVDACVVTEPDVVVLDAGLSGGAPATERLLERLRGRCPALTVVALGAHADRHHRELVLAAGAALHVPKGAPVGTLLDAVRRAASASSEG